MNKIKYLIKFVSKEQYADDFLDGKLFMHTATYYHELERRRGAGRGDLREASIFPGVAIYKNANLPIYCMYSVRHDQIFGNTIHVPKHVICDFNCECGYAVVTLFADFESLLSTCETYGYSLVGGSVQYGIPTKEFSAKMMGSKDIDNLFIKHPYFSHQREYRLVVWKSLLSFSHPEVINRVQDSTISAGNCSSVTYQLGTDIRSFSKKYSINCLPQDGEDYMFPLWQE